MRCKFETEVLLGKYFHHGPRSAPLRWKQSPMDRERGRGPGAFDAEGGAPNLKLLSCRVVNGHIVVRHGVVNYCYSIEEFSVVLAVSFWERSMGARRHDRTARWVTNMRAWAARRNISVSWHRPAGRHLSSSLLLLEYYSAKKKKMSL
jgi:hypothetical protein